MKQALKDRTGPIRIFKRFFLLIVVN